MLFRRKQKNRRLFRENILDVKLSSSQVRSARLRIAGSILTYVFGAVFVLFVLYRGGDWLANRLLYDNPTFTIAQIDVQTDGVIAIDQLRRWAMIKQGQNLLALDIAKVKRDLELVPLIADASVERILPNTLRIRITERDPIAQLPAVQPRSGGGIEQMTYHLDEGGFVMLPLDPRLRSRPPEFPNEQLPLLTGINLRDLRPGSKMDSDQIQAALQLIQEFSHSPMVGLADLNRIDLSMPESLRVFTSQGSEVVFSLGQLDVQMQRWRLIYDQTVRWGKAIGHLDLSISNNIPLNVLESGALSSGVSKMIKTPRNRKKHV